MNPLSHKDILGAGAKKRIHLSPENKFKYVLKEFKLHRLYSGSGKKVTNRKQAIAIAFSEKRRN